MFSNQQRQQIAAILGVATDLAIATVRPDGWPQVTTVSFVADGTRIYFGSWSKSQKVQNIERDARVSISVTPPYTDWSSIRGLSMSGHAMRVTDSAELGRVFELMVSKFPQIGQFLKGDDVEMALFRVDPEQVSILDYTQGFGHTEAASA
ncbi:MAG: pyridoxamine 5'-phosphate oxidase family protein [Hyphomonadaceae bacterium]|nr:pyridoxamine 5'-phosphate oxidase family protein [Caulobacteraceae bacterium]MBP6689548.1 pyridoxamine 5'-phosphate oxidase family protein [Hyphomonadaceae bacterium]